MNYERTIPTFIIHHFYGGAIVALLQAHAVESWWDFVSKDSPDTS